MPPRRQAEESAERWCEELAPRFVEGGAPVTCRKIAEGGDGFVFELCPAVGGPGGQPSLQRSATDGSAAAPPPPPPVPATMRSMTSTAGTERPAVLLKVMVRRLDLQPSAHNPPVLELARFVLSAIVRRFVAKSIGSSGFIAGLTAGHRVSPGCDGGGGGALGAGGGAGGGGIALDVALSMEHVRGSSLEKRCAKYRRGLSTRGCRDQVRDWTGIIAAVEQLAARLHSRGVVHRDLKPANIMYHGGREGAVAFVDFDTATFEGPTLERAGEAPGTPFWASPLQMVPPEASVPGGVAAWATAGHDRYSCAMMGLKMWCDAAGIAYLPYSHFATLRFPPAFYTQLQQRAGAEAFQFDEGLRRLLHRLFELFGVEGLELVQFSRELGTGGAGASTASSAAWSEPCDERTWASKRSVRRPRWRVVSVPDYPTAGLDAHHGEEAHTISSEEAIARLQQMRAHHCGGADHAEVEHAPPHELLCCARTTFHAVAFRRHGSGDAASFGGGSESTFDFGRMVAAILRMHSTVMDTIARFVHAWEDTAFDGAGAGGGDREGEAHVGATGAIPMALGLVPGDASIARTQAASWILREIDRSSSDTNANDASAASASGTNSTVLELEALATACINHCLGPLPPAMQVGRSAGVLARLRPKMRQHLTAISQMALSCSSTLAQLCSDSAAAADAAKVAVDDLHDALQYLTNAHFKPGAEIATVQVIIDALQHILASIETVASGSTAPAAVSQLMPFKHVVADTAGADSEGTARGMGRASLQQEQEWAIQVVSGMRAANFQFAFM